MVYNGYYKVMSNIPKMGHLPIPVKALSTGDSQRSVTWPVLNSANDALAEALLGAVLASLGQDGMDGMHQVKDR